MKLVKGIKMFVQRKMTLVSSNRDYVVLGVPHSTLCLTRCFAQQGLGGFKGKKQLHISVKTKIQKALF